MTALQCMMEARKLARAGAMMSRSDTETETETDDSGMEIMRAEVIEEEHWSAAEGSVSLDTTREEPPSLVSVENSANGANSVNNSTMAEEDLDLILQVEEHDKLDFEPDEAVLDTTTEVNCVNQCFSLRKPFRMIRTRSPRRNEENGCHNKFPSDQTKCIYDLFQFYNLYSTLIYYLYYLYYIGRTIAPQISNSCIMSIIVCQ